MDFRRGIEQLIMKKLLLTLFVLVGFTSAWAQDDLLNMIDQENPQKPVPVFATFKSTRVLTGQSIEHVAAKHLNFVILHRFGEVNGGAYTLYGLDEANMRLVFDYGLTKNIQLGAARTNVGKTYDVNLKVKLLNQSKGKGGIPFSLGYYSNVAINSERWADPTRNNYFTSRLTFFNQVIIAKKFGDRLSLQVAPTVSHQNLVPLKKDVNTMFVMGLGGSVKLNRSFRFNFEYYPRLNGRDMLSPSGSKCYDYLALGVDIETGGHVFQLMLSNGKGMLEQHMVRQTITSWSDLGIRLGFNISRTFSFDKNAKK